MRGLPTAAAVWGTAAVGAAAGAGLGILAAVATAVYLLVALAFPLLTRRLPRSSWAISPIVVRYLDGRGILRQVLTAATSRGFVIDEAATGSLHQDGPAGRGGPQPAPQVEVTLHVHGRGSVGDLAAALSELDGVEAVTAGDVNAITD